MQDLVGIIAFGYFFLKIFTFKLSEYQQTKSWKTSSSTKEIIRTSSNLRNMNSFLGTIEMCKLLKQRESSLKVVAKHTSITANQARASTAAAGRNLMPKTRPQIQEGFDDKMSAWCFGVV